MLCKNCGKEIYSADACNYCGYDPALDEEDGEKPTVDFYPPEETEIVTKKKKNIPSIVGLIFSILGLFPPFYFVGLVLNFVGLANVKYSHTGRINVIVAFSFLVFWIEFIVVGIIHLVSFFRNLYGS